MSELDEYVRRLDSAEEAERIYAAEDIGCANLAEGVAPLFARLPAEASRAVREAIFTALESIEDVAVIEGAVDLLGSEDTFVRNQAVELLRQRGPRVIPSLARVFAVAGKAQRKMVVDVLAAVDGPGSDEIYDRALADDDVNVVIAAVESLGTAGKTEFRERIEELFTGGHPMLAGACLDALGRIGTAHSLEVIRSRGPAGHPVTDFLLPSYLKLLGAHGSGGDIAEAAAMLGSPNARLQVSILDAITMLRRRHPLVSLPESLVEPLERIVHDGNPLLRQPALRLLKGLTQFGGVVAFLADREDLDQDGAARQGNLGA